MARTDRPYAQFNFTVDIPLEGWKADEPVGGFMEVSGLGVEITLTDYRTGNDIQNGVRKVPTLSKTADVTLKRGIMDTRLVFGWIDNARKGTAKPEDITIKMQDESGNDVIEWIVRGAQLSKVTYGPLSATGTEIAMEEIVLGCEWIDMKAIG